MRLELLGRQMTRWGCPKNGKLRDFAELQKACTGLVVLDVRERPVVLFARDWSVAFVRQRLPEVEFAETPQSVVVRVA